jgi:hypothetical protein
MRWRNANETSDQTAPEQDLTHRALVDSGIRRAKVVCLLSLQDQKIMEDAIRIAEMAQSKSITVRLLGALAVSTHSHNSADLFAKLGRLGNTDRVFTDVDFVGYSKQKGKLRGLFEDELKFKADIWSLLHMKDRIIYHQSDGAYKVDIFLDRLDYSHTVNFGPDPKKGRLGLDFPTISLADLMLEKLQIHQINEKDIKDIIILLHEHTVASGQEKEAIDAKYMASTLANSWGFWYDANANLDKVLTLGIDYVAKGMISNEILTDVRDKITQLKQYINAEPKSKDWKLREKVGTQKQWWKDVEEVSR